MPLSMYLPEIVLETAWKYIESNQKRESNSVCVSVHFYNKADCDSENCCSPGVVSSGTVVIVHDS